jgi:hypothetical protein
MEEKEDKIFVNTDRANHVAEKIVVNIFPTLTLTMFEIFHDFPAQTQ